MSASGNLPDWAIKSLEDMKEKLNKDCNIVVPELDIKITAKELTIENTIVASGFSIQSQDSLEGYSEINKCLKALSPQASQVALSHNSVSFFGSSNSGQIKSQAPIRSKDDRNVKSLNL